VPASELALTAVLFVSGVQKPIAVRFDVENAAYVAEQAGKIKAVRGGKAVVWLDLTSKVTKIWGYSEQGLLDVAFHPKDPERVFVHYTDRQGDTVVSEFPIEKGKPAVSKEKIWLTQKQPYSNHNGGSLEFGPDGALYLALGDGGSGGDPQGNGQNPSSRLGKILRLDVSKDDSAPEIWASGLRNPWRFSFDGRMIYIGDVGQDRWEEIDVAPFKAGQNFGWNVLEAAECFKAKTCDSKGFVAPVHVYRNGGGKGEGCSVIGGHVSEGRYFYADWCSGELRSFRYQKGKAVDHEDWSALGAGKWSQVSSLGRDRRGAVYVVGYDTGSVYKLVRP
jgi:glucose/arabinose dehydrogenase